MIQHDETISNENDFVMQPEGMDENATFIVNSDEVWEWEKTSQPGDVAVYHCGPALSLQYDIIKNQRLRILRRATYALQEQGKVILVQKPIPGTGKYQYMMQRISHKTRRYIEEINQ